MWKKKPETAMFLLPFSELEGVLIKRLWLDVDFGCIKISAENLASWVLKSKLCQLPSAHNLKDGHCAHPVLEIQVCLLNGVIFKFSSILNYISGTKIHCHLS